MRANTAGHWSVVVLTVLSIWMLLSPRTAGATPLDDAVHQALTTHGFTGRVEETLEPRLGRPVDRAMADLGRHLWFDTIASLNDDNACGGCHAPHAGFGDPLSIAIGIDNNGVVGPNRQGPRNQRRTPSVLNAAFYPRLMWNGRFSSNSGDPFDNSQGFTFPAPEGTSLSGNDHLLVAQVSIPPTERVEAAGFDFMGTNDDMRAAVVKRLNAAPEYIQRFAAVFPEVEAGDPISYSMFARATAEFEHTLVFANAPIDKFARGHDKAMTDGQKRGAVLFFGKAKCVSCHAVSGDSNEMFSDFDNHVLAVPQIVPSKTNVTFDGPGQNEDFGLEQFTGDPADRYKFRTSPLRNLAAAPAFMHNGAFTTIESAIRHHLDVPASVASFTTGHLAPDLQNPIAPMADALAKLDPAVAAPIALTEAEIADLVEFVRDGLTDERAKQSNLERLIPAAVPSGRPMLQYETFCSDHTQCALTEYCNAGSCEPKEVINAACSANVECESGRCDAGICKKVVGVFCKDIVRSTTSPAAVPDAFVSGDHPTWITGGSLGAWTGESEAGNENFTLVSFDLAGIPTTARVRSATARIHVAWSESAMEISSHPVLAPWSEKTVTYQSFVKPGAWDTMPFWTAFAGGGGYKDFDITALAADWLSGALPNRGLLLREPKYDSHHIYTSESSQTSLRPRLFICFSFT